MLLAEQSTINLALGFHCAQPVGNWESVIEAAHAQAYSPLLLALDAHPRVQATLHFTGNLLDWLEARHPDTLAIVRRLVGRGQVEMLAGGHFEPMLCMLPDVDKIGQVRKQLDAIERLTGVRPEGAWLAERVWEPHLALPLAEAGIRYVPLDDTPFRNVGLRGNELFGYYLTEEQGASLELLPINQSVRRLIPHTSPERLIDYLRELATPDGSRLVVCFDDGENWTTYPEGWLDRVFALLEANADWLRATTLTGYRQGHRPWGRIYVPTAASLEMQEWALPPEQASVFAEVVSEATGRQREFLRGGYWRHFLVRYPEANNLHKKMLHVGRLVAAAQKAVQAVATPDLVALGAGADLPGARVNEVPELGGMLERRPTARAAEGPERAGMRELRPGRPSDGWGWEGAREALWRGQANAPYWHGGAGGGLYLSHLRSAAYHNLLEAEVTCDRLIHGDRPFLTVDQRDFDADGAPEILVSSAIQNLYFTSQGGALFEADHKPKRFNLLDTLARRPEAYHARVGSEGVREDRGRAPQSVASRAGADPHPRGASPGEDLRKLLHHDWYRRLSLIDHFLHPDSYLESFYNVTYGEQGDFVNQAYTAEVREGLDTAEVILQRAGHVWVGHEFWPVHVRKRVVVPRDKAEFTAHYTLHNVWDRSVVLWFGVEFNVNLLAADAPDRGYYLPGGAALEAAHLASKGEVLGANGLGLRDLSLGLDVSIEWDRPATVWRFPVETVSPATGGGFERVYQSSAIMPHWRLELPANGSWDVVLSQRIQEI